MGLVFALQPDLRKSSPDELHIRSTKSRFGLGGAFIFGAALIGTLYLASAPIFKLFWREGAAFDKFLTIFIHAVIYGYPALAFICWFFESVVIVRRRADGRFDVESFKKLLGIKWAHKKLTNLGAADIHAINWLGSKNIARLHAEQKAVADRYATKGHWMLIAGDQVLERRARREEIELLLSQMGSYFGISEWRAAEPTRQAAPANHAENRPPT